MKLIHFADTHLGFRSYSRQTPAGRNQREADVSIAFSRAIDKTIELKPDLVVIGGDVFHKVQPGNPAIVYANREFARLVEALPNCPVVMVAGNHDMPRTTDTSCLLELFRQLGIHVATEKAERFTVGDVSVLAVPEGCKAKYEPDESAKYNVLLIHGETAGLIRKPKPSDDEIPLSELADERWNYVALGHYHTHTKVAERAYYSGSIDYTSTDIWGEARSGIPKGIIEHDLDSGLHTFHEIPGVRRVIDLPQINAQGLTAAEVTAAVQETVNACEGGIDGQIVRLVVNQIEKYVIRDLDHRMLRELQGRALHFNFDCRKPDAEEQAMGVAPRHRHKTIAERWVEFAGSRENSAGIDSQALIDLGLFYLAEVEAKEKESVVVESEQAA